MMRRLLLSIAIIITLCAQAQTEVFDPISRIQSRLDSMMRDPLLDYTQLGLAVWDLTDNRPLFSMNHKQLMRPASTMKVLTSITALDHLGGNYMFTTSLYYTGEIKDHTLEGDLYCVGGMDPAFSSEDMQTFAAALKEYGISAIHGRIVADLSMKDTLRWGEGWCWDDKNPTLSPLLVDRRDDFLLTLVSTLSESDILMDEVTLAHGKLPAEATLITQCQHSIDHILMRVLKDSDNLYAESLFYQLGAINHNRATAENSQHLEKALIERIGLNSNRYRLADGSGLSLYNYLSAECLLQLLRYAYAHPNILSHFLPALPIAGEDGTLKRRMKGTAAEGRVHAKTGTLTGVYSLAGYCTTSHGHQLGFSIINQGVQRASEARAFQDKICTILCE